MNNLSSPQAEPQMTYHIPAVGYSGFEKAWIIVDLVFCAIRIILVVFGLLGIFAMQQANPLYATALYEILSGIGIVLFGLTADILLLTKKPLGVKLGYLSLLFVLFSLGIGIWQVYIQLDQVAEAIPRTFGIFGAGFVLILRIAVNGIYAFVLKNVGKKLAAG